MIAIAALFFSRRTQTWLNRQKSRGYIYHCSGSVIRVSHHADHNKPQHLHPFVSISDTGCVTSSVKWLQLQQFSLAGERRFFHKVLVTVLKNSKQNNLLLSSRAAILFMFCTFDGRDTQLQCFVYLYPGYTDLVICVRGYTYHGDTHIYASPKVTKDQVYHSFMSSYIFIHQLFYIRVILSYIYVKTIFSVSVWFFAISSDLLYASNKSTRYVLAVTFFSNFFSLHWCYRESRWKTKSQIKAAVALKWCFT